MQVGVEIGGTFTDLVWVDEEGVVSVGKVPSTPSQVHKAVENAVDQAAVRLKEVTRFSHGSTIATNALITRRGARTGLLTTKGFRDITEIGLHDRVGNIYTAFYHKPRAPVERRASSVRFQNVSTGAAMWSKPSMKRWHNRKSSSSSTTA
ncbi:hydantoinase/oxoprolinase N-terminal domain-containing protein [Bradyrhizobium sp. Arg237L]|uniref:hydantoinase/oxoprolinase N-terminal domain-containing protein n=1 Tax=Bradyrhizobium sp. Arg237L TaxID=3003352 RepID=UPI00249E0F04|nr:hydantoinase/oxoprolinase N-terminal domain-containing protein [Bradyrhizobium sp. Arg237L]MDI4235601.1 hydantoinase/oxoprolinase N-terminal domain-containing protein [Bradyrhizobium sp. Arg237L]